jgi:hypothetical protein
MSNKSNFDKNEELLRRTLIRIDSANSNVEPISSYDLVNCFVLLNKLVAEHKKVLDKS